MSMRDLFHTFSIGRETFTAWAGNEPWLKRGTSLAELGGVSLGWPLIIEYVDNPSLPFTVPGFFVCKYDGNQPRISLHGMDMDQIEALGQEFAIRLGCSTGRPTNKPANFFDTQAGRNLVDWSLRHPRLSGRASTTNPYLGAWAERLERARATA